MNRLECVPSGIAPDLRTRFPGSLATW